MRNGRHTNGCGPHGGLAYDTRDHESFLRLRALDDALADGNGRAADCLGMVEGEWLLDGDKGAVADWWAIVEGVLDAEGGWVLSFSQRDASLTRSGVWRRDNGAAVKAAVSAARVGLIVYGGGEEQAVALIDALDTAFASFRPARAAGGQLPIVIWSLGSRGPDERSTVVSCPQWEQIRGNYPGCVDDLDWLMARRRPFGDGRIVFWHGPPGTGKTYAIRSLMRAWKTMVPELIADPEAFLGSAQYMQHVVTNDSMLDEAVLYGREGWVIPQADRGRLFILEDAGSLLLEDSRSEMGPLMARLLNLSDGLLGQGLRIVFLITTNEPLGAIDPAFTRPGRCIQVTHFPPLDPAQAASWLADHNSTATPPEPSPTLAELYATLDSRRPPSSTPPTPAMGFAR